jgi:transposase
MRPTDKTRNQDLARSQGDHSTLYVSLELSRSSWLVTSLSPNSDRMSKHSIAAGDAHKLLALLARLRGRAEQFVGGSLNVVVIQEAGLDGFWVHRSLEANDIESHVVDPASVAVSRRRRRAKTDMIDGETLLRTLLAWKRGEPPDLAGLLRGPEHCLVSLAGRRSHRSPNPAALRAIAGLCW